MFGVFAVELKQVLLKNKFKDSSEGLGGDRGVLPVESLVCFAFAGESYEKISRIS